MWGALRGTLRGGWLPSAPCRGLAKPAAPQSTRQLREAEEDVPVFQYAGKAAKRKDRVFVWGFCYSGALGIPSFVKPDAGWKKPRRIQATPYRLETEEKVCAGPGPPAVPARVGRLGLSAGKGVQDPDVQTLP